MSTRQHLLLRVVALAVIAFLQVLPRSSPANHPEVAHTQAAPEPAVHADPANPANPVVSVAQLP